MWVILRLRIPKKTSTFNHHSLCFVFCEVFVHHPQGVFHNCCTQFPWSILNALRGFCTTWVLSKQNEVSRPVFKMSSEHWRKKRYHRIPQDTTNLQLPRNWTEFWKSESFFSSSPGIFCCQSQKGLYIQASGLASFHHKSWKGQVQVPTSGTKSKFQGLLKHFLI